MSLPEWNSQIERRFRLRGMPDDAPREGVEIDRFYIESLGILHRYTNEGGFYFLGIKDPSDKQNSYSFEMPIRSDLFQTAMNGDENIGAVASCNVIHKVRYRLLDQNLYFELEEYSGNLPGLVILKCRSKIDGFIMDDVTKPSIFNYIGEEITNNLRYDEREMADKGLILQTLPGCAV